MTPLELLGYTASVLIVISLMMKNVRKLRFINMLGAAAFAAYGLFINAIPVFLLNSFTACVNLYYLIQMKRTGDFFSIMELPPMRMPYLDKFLDFYRNDIHKLMPDFDRSILPKCRVFFILRNLVPAGLFIYEQKENGVVDIHLDYVIPDYRDFKTAEYNFAEQSSVLKKQGMRLFRTRASSQLHRRYLQRLGFTPEADNSVLLIKPILP